ncbi:DUF3558 domain-containing protein [Amycolatopsis speibonae]|uniref:DUF3558 domain-containing protein n=1 Tax=Amycolatopsis speibonae TaxID=1450224 RepID=A0ABV7P9Y9_9PSEU
MTRRLVVSLGFFAAGAIVMSGCAGKGPEDGKMPSSENPPGSSAAPGLPYAGAPKVTAPLPATVLSGKPCSDALTADQVKTLLGSPVDTEPGETPNFGPDCGWTNPERGSQVGVAYATIPRFGLSGVYQNTKPKAAVWKPLADIQGFPAVGHAGQTGQTPPADFCAVTVGIADDLAVDVSVSLGRAKIGAIEPCDAAVQAANAVVTTLKAKAGA